MSTRDPIGRVAGLPAFYGALLADIQGRIRNAQARGAVAVNRELVLLYGEVGKSILERQRHEGWGAKVVDRLSADLRASFPDMRGFSPRNLKYMRAFAEAWHDEAMRQ
jgi:uncharacterized protein DUF1016